jgi:hypothetical protein
MDPERSFDLTDGFWSGNHGEIFSLKILMSIADFQGKSPLIVSDRNVVEAKAGARSASDDFV